MFLIGVLSSLVILSTVYHFFRKVNYGRNIGIDLSVIVVSLSYLILSLAFFIWSFEIFSFERIDFLVVYSFTLLLQTFGLVSILYHYNQNKKVFFSLFAILALIPLATINIFYLHFLIPLSLFIILLSFLTFSDSHQKSTSFLIAYASLSLFGYLVSFVFERFIVVSVLISTLLFFLFFYNFLEILRNHQKPFLPPKKKEESIIVSFLKHFIFIIIITNFIFIGTVSIHEIGHLVASSASPYCEGERIVYELDELPHTETECSDTRSEIIWVLAGLVLPATIALTLFFVGSGIMRELALQIFGFNLLISYRDLIALGSSKFLSLFGVFIGVLFLILSIVLMARSRTQQ